MRLPALLLALTLPLHAATLGNSQPAPSLTAERIRLLPAADQPAWTEYLQRSLAQNSLDRESLLRERATLTVIPPLPKEGFSARTMPLDRDPAFYASPTARHTADTILSFQLPNGGWSKNLDMSGPPRLPGQSYMANNLSRFLGPDDFDAPRDPQWNYAGTLDNDATNTELHFLALVIAQLPAAARKPYEGSFLRGIDYLLHAQYPNGGWPQVWPLEGGYHDAITFNDNAVTESAATLTAVAQGRYPFVPTAVRKQAAAAADRAILCILATQIRVDGKPTIWAQQHDPITLAPVAGRNFEPAALSASESADILLYLMQLPYPSALVQTSIRSGIAWLQKHETHDMVWSGGRGTPGGRRLTPAPGAPALWARYYALDTQKPIFGDRDKSIHDNVADLSEERRNGYAWYSSSPQRALDAFTTWSHDHPADK